MSDTSPTSIQEDAATRLLFDLTAILREETGMNERFAGQLAEAVLLGLQRRYSSERVYIPAAVTRDRDAQVREAWNGKNRDQICNRFGISRATFYSIIGKKK